MADFQEQLERIRRLAARPGAHSQVPCAGRPGCEECARRRAGGEQPLPNRGRAE